jgi:hypothetical protein
VGATIVKLLGVKSLVIKTTLEHVFIPLLGWAKQEERVALVGGRTGVSVRKKLMVDWKMCKTVVASEQSPSPFLSLLALSASKLNFISLGLDLNEMTTIVSGDERLTSAVHSQQLVASLNVQNGFVQQASTTLSETDSTRMGNKGGVIEGAPNCSNIISPFTNSRRQWRPHFASSIQAIIKVGKEGHWHIW